MFDPLHQWFGIPPDEQPPDYYRLLGIARFEANPDVIDAAFDRQMTYLHGCANGEHAELAESLMNDVSRARLCLINPEKKASYDAHLLAEVESPPTPTAAPSMDAPLASPIPGTQSTPPLPSSPASPPAAAEPSSAPPDSVSGKTSRDESTHDVTAHVPRHHKHRNLINGIFAIVVSVLLLGLVYLVLEIQLARKAQLELGDPDMGLSSESTAIVSESTSPAAMDSGSEDDLAPAIPSPPQTELDNQVENEPSSTPTSAPPGGAEMDRPSDDQPEPPPKPAEPEPELSKPAESSTHEDLPQDHRLPIPSPTEIAAAQALILELYRDKIDAAKTPLEKSVLAQEIYQVGIDTTDDPVGRFVLWQMFALPMMLQNDNDYAAFILMDRLGQEYVYPAITEKSQFLLSTSRANLQNSPSLQSHFPELVEQAIAADELTIAANLLKHWRSAAPSKHRSSLQSVQDQVAMLQERQEAYFEAVERLLKLPQDPGSNMLVGHYLCFLKRQWKEGLPYLVASGDKAIAEAAALEIKYHDGFSRTTEVEVELGDRWYSATSQVGDETVRRTIGQRAAHWYGVALPRISKGVTRLKAEKRIAEFSSDDVIPIALLRPERALLGYQRYTSDISRSSSARRSGNELVVSMGRTSSGLGEAMVGLEFLGIEKLRIALALTRRINFVTEETKFGYVIDFGSPVGYQHRVFLGVGLFTKQQYNSNPPWGTHRPPDAKVTLEPGPRHEIDLRDYAPSDWDGRSWLTLYMQNAGSGCIARAQVQFY